MSDTVAELVRSRADDEHLGLQFEGTQWTWAEVEREMEVRGAFLEDLVPDALPHVGVLLDNVPEYLFLHRRRRPLRPGDRRDQPHPPG